MADLGKEGKVSQVRDCAWVPGRFENLAAAGFDEVKDCTSDRTQTYNCIAWAAGRMNEWWWPWDIGGYTWPKGEGIHFELPDQETVENFVSAFKSQGYLECQNGSWEEGFEKVAIFSNHRGTPTHAARSLPNGAWTSKLGQREDIQHSTMESIGGRVYGKPTAFLKRVIQNA